MKKTVTAENLDTTTTVKEESERQEIQCIGEDPKS
jgi:hypothetical protein